MTGTWAAALCRGLRGTRISILQTFSPIAFTHTPGWAALTKQMSWTSLELVWRRPPGAAATGRPSRWVRASLWPFSGGQAGSSCCWSRASGVGEVHLCRRPASYLGPSHLSRSPRHGACGLALRRSSNPPLGSELKAQEQRVLEYKERTPGSETSSLRTARRPTLW